MFVQCGSFARETPYVTGLNFAKNVTETAGQNGNPIPLSLGTLPGRRGKTVACDPISSRRYEDFMTLRRSLQKVQPLWEPGDGADLFDQPVRNSPVLEADRHDVAAASRWGAHPPRPTPPAVEQKGPWPDLSRSVGPERNQHVRAAAGRLAGRERGHTAERGHCRDGQHGYVCGADQRAPRVTFEADGGTKQGRRGGAQRK